MWRCRLGIFCLGHGLLPWVMMMEELRPSIAKILIVELSNSSHRKVLKIEPHLRLDPGALPPESWLDRL